MFSITNEINPNNQINLSNFEEDNEGQFQLKDNFIASKNIIYLDNNGQDEKGGFESNFNFTANDYDDEFDPKNCGSEKKLDFEALNIDDLKVQKR